jgi:hypothetical protein
VVIAFNVVNSQRHFFSLRNHLYVERHSAQPNTYVVLVPLRVSRADVFCGQFDVTSCRFKYEYNESISYCNVYRIYLVLHFVEVCNHCMCVSLTHVTVLWHTSQTEEGKAYALIQTCNAIRHYRMPLKSEKVYSGIENLHYKSNVCWRSKTSSMLMLCRSVDRRIQGNTILQNIGNYSPSCASHPRRIEFSATPLCYSQIWSVLFSYIHEYKISQMYIAELHNKVRLRLILISMILHIMSFWYCELIFHVLPQSADSFSACYTRYVAT